MPDELTHLNEGGSGPSLDVLGIDADAITALNAALQGVEALRAVVFLMELAAGGIVTATDTAKGNISDYVDQDLREAIFTKFNDAMPDLLSGHIAYLSNELERYWGNLSEPPRSFV